MAALLREPLDTVALNNPLLSPYRQPERVTLEKWRATVPDDFRFAVEPQSVHHPHQAARHRTRQCRALVRHHARARAHARAVAAEMEIRARSARRVSAARGPAPAQARARAARRQVLVREALAFLRERNVALWLFDTPQWPSVDAVTAGFVYIRFHGPERLYASNYPDDMLRAWAERIRAWRSQGLDVYG